jgi:hypothetical protein
VRDERTRALVDRIKALYASYEAAGNVDDFINDWAWWSADRLIAFEGWSGDRAEAGGFVEEVRSGETLAH